MKERQYRGIVWSQINARDWTILAYLKSDQGGPGLGTLPRPGDAATSVVLGLKPPLSCSPKNTLY
ncbi:MAG: hypothetical protein WCL46_08830 [Chlorobium sp.]